MPPSQIRDYHAHIYYRDATERLVAEKIREDLGAHFPVTLGRWRDEPVGPHPAPMFQAAFAVEAFPDIVPWLMLNRAGLTVLVHPDTGRPREDHLRNALWMGEVLPLNGSRLPETS